MANKEFPTELFLALSPKISFFKKQEATHFPTPNQNFLSFP